MLMCNEGGRRGGLYENSLEIDFMVVSDRPWKHIVRSQSYCWS